MPSLYNRQLQDITALMCKVKHGLVSDCVSDIFIRKDSTHSLRNVILFYHVMKLHAMASTLAHSVRYFGPFLWSKLTDNQRDSPSLSVFINKIRKLHLVSRATFGSFCNILLAMRFAKHFSIIS